ncbi:MAG: FAD-binding oxidoreductase [Pseudomonadota bacterium]
MTIPTMQGTVVYQDELPDKVDVAIIGGGVIGVCTARFLQEAGLSVLICEKGRIAAEQSSRNWGWVRQQGRDVAELPIMMESIKTWEQISQALGPRIGFERHGVMYIARTEKELAKHEAWLETAKQHELESCILSADEVHQRVKSTPDAWQGALFTPSDGRAEPFTAVPAIAEDLHKKGVFIREYCAVRALDMTAGQTTGIVTEHGPVGAQAVVCCGGAWSSTFLGNLGVSLPQLTVRATVVRTTEAPDVGQANAAGGGLAFRRRQDGGYTLAAGGTNEHFISADSFKHFFKFQPALRQSARDLSLKFGGDLMSRLFPTRRWRDDEVSPFEKTRILDPAPSEKSLTSMRRSLQNYLPELANVGFADAWAGMIDVMPDVVPVMDKIDSHPGLYLATGFSGHGFGFGPGAGRVMADMVLGHQPAYDLQRFRFERFTDGSQIVPGPGL